MDHSGGTEEEIESIWKMAMEELFSSKCSGASMPCAICGHLLNARSSLWQHVIWQCKLCGERMKHERNNVKHHLEHRHFLNWAEYQEISREQGEATRVKKVSIVK